MPSHARDCDDTAATQCGAYQRWRTTAGAQARHRMQCRPNRRSCSRVEGLRTAQSPATHFVKNISSLATSMPHPITSPALPVCAVAAAHPINQSCEEDSDEPGQKECQNQTGRGTCGHRPCGTQTYTRTIAESVNRSRDKHQQHQQPQTTLQCCTDRVLTSFAPSRAVCPVGRIAQRRRCQCSPSRRDCQCAPRSRFSVSPAQV